MDYVLMQLIVRMNKALWGYNADKFLTADPSSNPGSHVSLSLG